MPRFLYVRLSVFFLCSSSTAEPKSRASSIIFSGRRTAFLGDRRESWWWGETQSNNKNVNKWNGRELEVGLCRPPFFASNHPTFIICELCIRIFDSSLFHRRDHDSEIYHQRTAGTQSPISWILDFGDLDVMLLDLISSNRRMMDVA